MHILSNIKNILKRKREAFAVRRLFHKSGSQIGKTLSSLNSRYISVGRNVVVKDYARIDCYDKFSKEVLHPSFVIGDGVIIQYNFSAFIADNCFIGDNTIIAHAVSIITENHGMNPEHELPYHAQPLTTAPVSIGKNCWIGCSVSFLPGSSVGDNCVVASNCVVRGVFPDNVVIAGIPARVVKKYNFEKHCWESVERE